VSTLIEEVVVSVPFLQVHRYLGILYLNPNEKMKKNSFEVWLLKLRL